MNTQEKAMDQWKNHADAPVNRYHHLFRTMRGIRNEKSSGVEDIKNILLLLRNDSGRSNYFDLSLIYLACPSIIKRIIASHDDEVTIENHPDQGTIMTIMLMMHEIRA